MEQNVGSYFTSSVVRPLKSIKNAKLLLTVLRNRLYPYLDQQNPKK